MNRWTATSFALLGAAFGAVAMLAATGEGPQPFSFVLACLIGGCIVGCIRELK